MKHFDKFKLVVVLTALLSLAFGITMCKSNVKLSRQIVPSTTIQTYTLASVSFIDTDTGLVGQFIYTRPVYLSDSTDCDIKTFIEPRNIYISRKCKDRNDLGKLKLILEY